MSADRRLELFHRLPGPARSAVASLRGLYLRSWRYGAETERCVAEALARDRWTESRVRAERDERLAHVLERAASRVPYYRDRWAARRRAGDRASPACLENWPILEKEAVRADPLAFLADGGDRRRMFEEHTSGTSGTPLTLYWSALTMRRWYALWEARARRWYGVSRRDRWGIFGGQLVAPVDQQGPPYWVWNAGLNQLYLSSYHLSPDRIGHYLDAIVRYRVKYLLGYTSALHSVAAEALRLNRRDITLRVVVTNAEPLLAYQRRVIADAFHCPVRETYGMAELVAAASECEAGRLHLWPETGIVEILDGERPVASGEPGDLVCTGLLNADMPLIRYRLGDRGALASPGASCACGRTLPILASVDGRADDVLRTPDGRLVGRLDPVFKADLPIREAQIVQERLDRVRVRYVPAPEFSAAAGRAIVDRLRSVLGEVEVALEPVDQLPRTAAGKLRGVICELDR
jgi:phenylacetate-CoA ligase